jgi:hypothetical protein
MHPPPTRTGFLAAALALALLALPAAAQDTKLPPISTRMFTAGSIFIKVTGSFQIDAEVPINPGSYADGEMTWLGFGNSGAVTPNALLTFDPQGFGVSAGVGRQNALGEAPACKGKIEVTPTLVSGEYTCTGITSYDSGTRQMGTVNIQVRFTART